LQARVVFILETAMTGFIINAAEASGRLDGRDLGGGQYQSHHHPLAAHSPGRGDRDREWSLRENERTGLGNWRAIGEVAIEIFRSLSMESDFMRASWLDDERGGGR
jgi:hypothetical protein